MESADGRGDCLPSWPLPDGGLIGKDRARAYVAWIREHAPPYPREARQMLHVRYPGASVEPG
jgi:hypothetical protein